MVEIDRVLSHTIDSPETESVQIREINGIKQKNLPDYLDIQKILSKFAMTKQSTEIDHVVKLWQVNELLVDDMMLDERRTSLTIWTSGIITTASKN